MSFSFEIEEADGLIVLHMSGRLIDRNSGEDILTEVDNARANGNSNFIINLSKLDYLNSNGLNVLITILTKARNAGGEAVLCNVSSKVEQLFIVTKLNTVFTISENLEDAQKAIANTSNQPQD